jgi:hypothetical protein
LKRIPISISIALLFLSQALAATAQAAPSSDLSWNPLQFLVGDWVGEGTAETGQPGAGSCSFAPDLQSKALIRKNHAEYPASGGRPAIAHDDLMIIYPDSARHQLRAFYTDNEGNVISYTVTASADDKSVVFLGDIADGSPRFRLTYTLTQPGHMTIAFEMAPPGKPDQFQKFIEGKMRKSA